jgi:hypothetical protein
MRGLPKEFILIAAGLILAVILSATAGPLLQESVRKAEFETLNKHIPASFKCLTVIQGGGQCSAAEADALKKYFKIITVVMPQRDDAWAMLGFMTAAEGRDAVAEKYFLRARALNPEFFWHGFNAALVQSRLGKNREAAALLRAAVELPPEATLNHVVESKIFLDVFRETGYPLSALVVSLQDGHRQAHGLMAVLESQPEIVKQSNMRARLF